MTGETACRNCGTVVTARNPLRILSKLGQHAEECEETPLTPEDEAKARLKAKVTVTLVLLAFWALVVVAIASF